MAAVDTYFIYRYLLMLLPASPVGRVQFLLLGGSSFSGWELLGSKAVLYGHANQA